MFGIKEFLWIKSGVKTKILWDNVKAFNTAIYVIKDFIELKEWEKASLGISEITKKEQEHLDNRLNSLKKDSKEANAEIKKVNARFKELTNLKNKLKKEKEIYDELMEVKRYKIRFKSVEENLNIFIKRKEFVNALNILNLFMSEFPSNDKVIHYVTQKKKLLQKIKTKNSKSKKMSILQEAKSLVWNNVEIKERKNIPKQELKFWIKLSNYFSKIREKRKKINDRKLLDEIRLTLNEKWGIIDSLMKEKITNIHNWLTKEISWVDMVWYDFYWKIMWADKISWDSFWFKETRDFCRFFLWDATGHWIKAWLMVSVLSSKFEEISWRKDFKEVAKELNNSLKQELQSWNFVTSIYYEVDKKNYDKINFIWMWHEPMFVFREKSKKIDKVIPGWVAAWIRILKDTSSIKTKELILENWDITIAYSDWIVEAKNPVWEFYWFERLKESFKNACIEKKWNTKKIYDRILEDVSEFHWWSKFDDDLTIILIKRNVDKNIIEEDSKLNKIIEEFWLDKKQALKYKWKSLSKIREEIKKDKEIEVYKNIRKNLKEIYIEWDFLKLKQETIRYIKQWYVHKDINFYLKKANSNEFKQKIKIKNEKLKNKYKVLKWLYDTWNYTEVIKECEEIISKDWNI